MARYTINGAEYPSVTEILGLRDKSDALIGWATGLVGKRIRELAHDDGADTYIVTGEQIDEAVKSFRAVQQEALDIGSAVHNAIEQHVKHGREPGALPDQAKNGYDAFLAWERDHHVVWLESEAPVVNDLMGYAGTLDALAEVDGVPMLVDFKTSKSIYPEYWMQAAAYRVARLSMEGRYNLVGPDGSAYSRVYNPVHAIDALGILRVDKLTGLPDWQIKTDPEWIRRRYDAFDALLRYYYLEADRKLAGNVIAKSIREAYK